MIRIALLALLLLVGGAGGAAEFAPSQPTPIEFVVRDREGGVHASAELRARVTLVHFWATWCLPCRTELPALKSLNDDMRSEGVRVAAISVDRLGWGAIDRTIRDIAVAGLPIYHDVDRAAAQALKVDVLPMTILMDSEGREIARLRGQGDWGDIALRRAIRAYAGN